MTIHIGSDRPKEPPDALERCKLGAWIGDRERKALERGAWAELGPPPARMWSVRKRREAA